MRDGGLRILSKTWLFGWNLKVTFLTVVACEIGRNRYLARTHQRTGFGCLVGIMGNLSYEKWTVGDLNQSRFSFLRVLFC